MYLNAESYIRKSGEYKIDEELKACILNNRQKGKLFRSLNNFNKFGVVINQNKVHDVIFQNKKSKQRYLDYAYKIGLKNAIKNYMQKYNLQNKDVENIHIFTDEHTTATNGRYELKEGLEQEFKYGTFNYSYNKFYQPLFPDMKGIDVKYCNSNVNTLIRAADIIANKVYFHSIKNQLHQINNKVFLTKLP